MTSESGPLGVRLTASQRRRLTVALGKAEAALDAVRQASTASEPLRLSAEVADLPGGFPGPLRILANGLEQELRTLADGLGLQPLTSSRRRHLLSLCTTGAIGLYESRTRGLRGYGAVDPLMGEVVDPVLTRLETGLYQIAEALSDRTEE
ncbi:MAG: hypothetical protein ACREL4_06845 [Gemmatimonadales bacterium]